MAAGKVPAQGDCPALPGLFEQRSAVSLPRLWLVDAGLPTGCNAHSP